MLDACIMDNTLHVDCIGHVGPVALSNRDPARVGIKKRQVFVLLIIIW